MSLSVEGRYFLPHATRFVAARASATGERRLRIEDAAGALISETPASELRISAKLGRLAQWIEFRDGGRFESSDDDGIEALRKALRLRAPGRILSHLERSWRWIAASLVVAIMLSYGFIEYGIPWIADDLAVATPSSVTELMSRQTLQFLDKAAIDPTKLSAAERQRATNLFAKVARREPRGLQGYRLMFREGGAIGANAFALPDGTIVMTDELWKDRKSVV